MLLSPPFYPPIEPPLLKARLSHHSDADSETGELRRSGRITRLTREKASQMYDSEERISTEEMSRHEWFAKEWPWAEGGSVIFQLN